MHDAAEKCRSEVRRRSRPNDSQSAVSNHRLYVYGGSGVDVVKIGYNDRQWHRLTDETVRLNYELHELSDRRSACGF